MYVNLIAQQQGDAQSKFILSLSILKSLGLWEIQLDQKPPWYSTSACYTPIDCKFERDKDQKYVSKSLQHDTTVSALQMALDVYNGILPPYASCHMMELYFQEG